MPKIKEVYFKKIRRGHPPAMYQAWGDGETNRVKKALIKKDPILKKYPKYEKAILGHEYREIKLRSKGMDIKKAHKVARAKEPDWLRVKSLPQMWRDLK